MSSINTRWEHLPQGADSGVRVKRASYALMGIICIVLLWLTVASTSAQQQEVTLAGKNEYQQYCAVCHGRDGTGAGAMAKLLKVKPANLTRLSAKHDGIFPFWDVYRIIDGRKEIGGHGAGDMRSGAPCSSKSVVLTSGRSCPLMRVFSKSSTTSNPYRRLRVAGRRRSCLAR